MKALIADLLDGFVVQRNLDNVSPASRAAGERLIRDLERRARVSVDIYDGLGGPASYEERTRAVELLAVENDAMAELKAWREMGGRLLPFAEQIIAAQGDAADPDLVRLQHELAEFLNPT